MPVMPESGLWVQVQYRQRVMLARLYFKNKIQNKKVRAWLKRQSACVASMRPWVQSTGLLKNKVKLSLFGNDMVFYILKSPKLHKRASWVAQEVECLPSKFKALGSISSTAKKVTVNYSTHIHKTYSLIIFHKLSRTCDQKQNLN
jgi:hypothetical protein